MSDLIYAMPFKCSMLRRHILDQLQVKISFTGPCRKIWIRNR